MEKTFKVTITPQSEEYIEKYGKKTHTLEADAVIITTEDNAFTVAESTPIKLAEAIVAFDSLVEDLKKEDGRIEKAIDIIKMCKSLRDIEESVDRDKA